MTDRTDAYDEKVERLAKKLMHGDDGNGTVDIETARKQARRMLEESEARTADPAAYDPEDPDVIRRSSGETAASGDTGGTRYVTDGE